MQAAAIVRQSVADLKIACAGLGEATASRAPEGRWSPKEILSHLLNPEGKDWVAISKRVLAEDTPTIDLYAETFYSAERAQMSFAALLARLEKDYEALAQLAAGLSDEQLARKAHISLFKDSPLGEYPALGDVIAGVGAFHVPFHIDHIREIIEALKTGGSARSVPTGAQLAQTIRQNAADLKIACAGLDEATASRAPKGRWSPKEVLSHLLGPGAGGTDILMAVFKRILTEDTPTIDIVPDDPFYSAARAQMSFAALLAEVEEKFEAIAAFAASLTDEQLARKAHIPAFKDYPLGEYPALGNFIGGIGAFHVKFHIDHLGEITRALSGK